MDYVTELLKIAAISELIIMPVFNVSIEILTMYLPPELLNFVTGADGIAHDLASIFSLL